MGSYSTDQYAAAQSQASYASTGQSAEGLSDLEGYTLFANVGPSDLASAYVYSAYFKAAAGRMLGGFGGASLGASAIADLVKAKAYGWSPVTIAKGMTETLKAAYDDIRASTGGTSVDAEVASMIRPLVGYTQTAELKAYDDSFLGKMQKWFDTLGDIAKGVGLAVGALSLFGLGYLGYRLYRSWGGK